MNTFGARLRAARKGRGLSQDEFAALAGVSRNAQVNYEADKRAPDAGYLLALAQAGIDVMMLLTSIPAAAHQKLATISQARDVLVRLGVPGEQGAALLEALFGQMNAALAPVERLLLDHYRKCSEPDQEQIRKLAERLAPLGETS